MLLIMTDAREDVLKKRTTQPMGMSVVWFFCLASLGDVAQKCPVPLTILG